MPVLEKQLVVIFVRIFYKAFVGGSRHHQSVIYEQEKETCCCCLECLKDLRVKTNFSEE